MKKRNKIVGLVISLIAIPTFAFAQAKSKVYIGAEYTQNKIDTGISNISSSLDEKDNGFSIFLGSEVDKNIDVELSYNNFGKASLSGVSGNRFSVDGTTYQFTGTGSFEAKASSFGIAVRPKLPLTENFNIGATLGVHRWSSELSAASSAGFGKIENDGFDYFYGANLNATFNNVTAGIGYNIYKVDGDDIKSLGLRVAAKF